MARKHKVDVLIRHISQLVTMDPRVDGAGECRVPRCGEDMRRLGIIEDGAVAVKDGVILAAGPDTEVMRHVGAVRRGNLLKGEGRCVTPGFIDAHTHAVFAGTRESELVMRIQGRTYREISAAGGGILRTVKATRSAADEEIVRATRRRLNSMLVHGTTTAEVKSGYGLSTDQELRLLRIVRRLGSQHPMTLVPTFMGAHAVPPEFSGRGDAYVDAVIREMLPKVASEEAAVFCDVFCDEGAFTADQTARILEAAREHGFLLKLHMDEFKDVNGVDVAARLRARSCEHLVVTPKEKRALLKEAGCTAVLLPGTTFMLGSDRYADARGLIGSGVPVALGTDLCPNSYIESMQVVIALACVKMRMRPSEALCAATVNAAHAIEQAGFTGMLASGKRADLLLLDVPSYTHIPYRFGANLVHTVVKSGRIVVDGRTTRPLAVPPP